MCDVDMKKKEARTAVVLNNVKWLFIDIIFPTQDDIHTFTSALCFVYSFIFSSFSSHFIRLFTFCFVLLCRRRRLS